MPAAIRTSVPAPASAATPSATESVALAWQVHRLRQEPERLPCITLSFAATAAVWWLVFPLPALLPVPLLCLTIALNDFLFPMRYRLTAQGAHCDGGFCHLFIAWSDVRRATKGREGVYLSPFARSCTLEAFRGVKLRFADNAEEVIGVVKQLRQEVQPMTGGAP